ncbi:hypothetical protein [Paenarthrobacter nitroguajacolicus]|uniref:hypothetical protein n=1 Tax=Paenarthrobacter nitroguajacolicus TaxID=211146 RepID=UPI00248BB89B|nr:hypothetical protein [Paenarthrobacter nitroguajacolicus]MDI2034714.1 hypothetical protein [Paenarthrobacter nitroguajacolicus]
MSKFPRSRTVVLTFLVILSALLTGCSQRPSAEALESPAKEVSSAVRAASLAVDLRISDSTTAAAASTTADDMLGDVESATDHVHRLSAQTQEERVLRNDALAAFSSISRALLHARDALTSSSGGPNDGQGQTQLTTVQGELRVATEQLDSLMTKAGIQ